MDAKDYVGGGGGGSGGGEGEHGQIREVAYWLAAAC